MTVVISRRTARRPRSVWYAAVTRLRAEGMSGVEIARKLGLSHSFVYGLLSDPDGSKDRERKRKYGGVCVDCGSPTDGSNGRTGQPERCRSCVNKLQRYWTRDRVIEAIQRFVREHGRTPRASDWNDAGRGDGYPPATSCYYIRGGNETAPFRYWADAIEAAGFPRPHVGHYDRTVRTK